MSLFNINPSDPAHHIERIGDRPEDRDSRRRFAKHKGRQWEEREADEGAQPVRAIPHQPGILEKKERIWERSEHAKKAKELFETLTTLEEKVAQLIFVTAEAIYDTTLQRELELLIQTWQIGGVVFTEGELKREAYLVEKLQEVSKTPLMFGNDFFHGLSFYFEEDSLTQISANESESRFHDLGKAVMGINKKLGIQLQLCIPWILGQQSFSKQQYEAFKKGVRMAGGFVGNKHEGKSYTKVPSLQLQNQFPRSSLVTAESLSSLSSKPSAQQFVGMRSLSFMDLKDGRDMGDKIQLFIKESCDAFIVDKGAENLILHICRAIKSGRISEKEIDQRVLKLLYFKVQTENLSL